MTNILNPQSPDNANTTIIQPDMEVLVPFSINDTLMSLLDDNPEPLMFNKAYLDEVTARKHCFWMHKSNMSVELRKMTARDFIKANFENGAMNPFEKLNQLKFITNYNIRFQL